MLSVINYIKIISESSYCDMILDIIERSNFVEYMQGSAQAIGNLFPFQLFTEYVLPLNFVVLKDKSSISKF